MNKPAYIPGLDIFENKSKECLDLNVGNYRSLDEFQKAQLLKCTEPLSVFRGYDLRKNKSVTLVRYSNLQGPEDEFDAFIRETTILSSLKHENILEFYCKVYGRPELHIDRYNLLLEPFECFLSQLIRKENEIIFEQQVIKCIMQQLFTGLKYLHEQDIIHKDLTPKNIIVKENGTLKISNFRSAHRSWEKSRTVLTLEFRYQPIDLLLGSESCSLAVDIWSATCILAELLLKQRLFNIPGEEGVLSRIFSILGFPDKLIWPEFTNLPDLKYLIAEDYHQYNCLSLYCKRNGKPQTPKCMDLLQRGFAYNPHHRYTAAECLKHPYFLEEPIACQTKVLVRVLDRKFFSFPVEY